MTNIIAATSKPAPQAYFGRADGVIPIASAGYPFIIADALATA
ncbi:MAG: hypothetical protein Q9M19_04645 [Mariprofundaceae bacterium]|nr:hypothetical protein [Mariprofundaceae bacterium]